jgi:hypothetical protein
MVASSHRLAGTRGQRVVSFVPQSCAGDALALRPHGRRSSNLTFTCRELIHSTHIGRLFARYFFLTHETSEI